MDSLLRIRALSVMPFFIIMNCICCIRNQRHGHSVSNILQSEPIQEALSLRTGDDEAHLSGFIKKQIKKKHSSGMSYHLICDVPEGFKTHWTEQITMGATWYGVWITIRSCTKSTEMKINCEQLSICDIKLCSSHPVCSCQDQRHAKFSCVMK